MYRAFKLVAITLLISGCAGAGNAPIAKSTPVENPTVSRAISDKISHNWYVLKMPDSARPIVVNLRLNDDASVRAVKIVKSSGNAGLDDSLMRAIRKSSPLPVPANEVETYRDFLIEFDPTSKRF